jgi:hypothetical protein
MIRWERCRACRRRYAVAAIVPIVESPPPEYQRFAALADFLGSWLGKSGQRDILLWTLLVETSPVRKNHFEWLSVTTSKMRGTPRMTNSASCSGFRSRRTEFARIPPMLPSGRRRKC